MKSLIRRETSLITGTAKGSLILTFSSIFWIFCFCSPCFAVQITKIKPLIENAYRPGYWYPVLVQVSGDKDGFCGDLVAVLNSFKNRISVQVAPWQVKSYVLYFIPYSSFSKFSAYLVKGEEVFFNVHQDLSIRPLKPDETLIGYYNLTNPPILQGYIVNELSVIPDQWIGLEAFDILIIATGAIDANEEKVISDWSIAGGKVFLYDPSLAESGQGLPEFLKKASEKERLYEPDWAVWNNFKDLKWGKDRLRTTTTALTLYTALLLSMCILKKSRLFRKYWVIVAGLILLGVLFSAYLLFFLFSHPPIAGYGLEITRVLPNKTTNPQFNQDTCISERFFYIAAKRKSVFDLTPGEGVPKPVFPSFEEGLRTPVFLDYADSGWILKDLSMPKGSSCIFSIKRLTSLIKINEPIYRGMRLSCSNQSGRDWWDIMYIDNKGVLNFPSLKFGSSGTIDDLSSPRLSMDSSLIPASWQREEKKSILKNLIRQALPENGAILVGHWKGDTWKTDLIDWKADQIFYIITNNR